MALTRDRLSKARDENGALPRGTHHDSVRHVAKSPREALRLTCRAPSFHNSQPWQWVLEDDTLELHLDPHRLDSSGRQALLSCGAVLDHLRVARRSDC